MLNYSRRKNKMTNQDRVDEYKSDLANDKFWEAERDKLDEMDLRDVLSLLPDDKENEFRKQIVELAPIPLIDLLDYLDVNTYRKVVNEIKDEIIRLGLNK